VQALKIDAIGRELRFRSKRPTAVKRSKNSSSAAPAGSWTLVTGGAVRQHTWRFRHGARGSFAWRDQRSDPLVAELEGSAVVTACSARSHFMEALFISFSTVTVAEMGDRTQLLSLAECALRCQTPEVRSRVPELGSLGTVRGALGNGCPYREHHDRVSR
jgi:hypothetical protein